MARYAICIAALLSAAICVDVPTNNTPLSEVLAKVEARDQAILARLKESTICEVLGLVDPHGSGGTLKDRATDRWTWRFTFENWKIKGGALQNKKLRVQRDASKVVLGELMKEARAYGILEIRCHLCDDEVDAGLAHALLVEMKGKNAPDADLSEVAEALRKPVTFEDNQFGTFTLLRQYNWFEASVRWSSDDTVLRLEMKGSADSGQPLRVAHALWAQQSLWNERILDCAANNLLELKNDTWLKGNEVPLTAAEFKKRLRLQSLAVQGNGKFEFWFDDGDLFWGHSIMVNGNLGEGPKKAGIHG